MEKEERNLGMFCHLAALAGFIIPFGNIVGPLIIWMLKKEEYPFVDDQGKESLNFQITVTIGYIIGGILTVVLIGILVLIALAIISLIFTIIAIIKSSEGEEYRYPFNLRLIK